MRKLLSGQQLYMSKHIVSQIANDELIPPADPRPFTPLTICLRTTTLGLLDYDCGALGFQAYQAGGEMYPGTRLTSFDYQFNNIPNPMPALMLHWASNIYMYPYPRIFTDRKTLQTIHYIRFGLSVSARFGTVTRPGRTVFFYLPGGSIGGLPDSDTYPFDVSIDANLRARGKFHLIYHGPTTFTHSVTDYTLPNSTELYFMWGDGSIPPGYIHILRDRYGNYTYQQDVP